MSVAKSVLLLIFICTQCLLHLVAVSNKNQPTLMDSSCADIFFHCWNVFSGGSRIWQGRVSNPSERGTGGARRWGGLGPPPENL